MPITGVRFSTLALQAISHEITVEALPIDGKVPTLSPAQQLIATVLESNGRGVVINLNGTQVSLTALPGFLPGAEVPVKVVQVTPKLLLEITPPSVKPSGSLPPLAIGQEVTAKIIDELSGGTVLIDLQGALLEAEILDPLPVGKSFSARVEQLRPQVLLHMLGEVDDGTTLEAEPSVQTEAARLVRTYIPHRIASAESFSTLTQELSSFVAHPAQVIAPLSLTKLQTLIKTLLPDQSPPTAERLAKFIRDGGLHYEAKLSRFAAGDPQALSQATEADLKGLLLQALKDLDSAQPPQVETDKNNPLSIVSHEKDTTTFTSSLVSHLEHIESQQAINLLAQERGEPYQIQIPFFTAQGLTTAFLSIAGEGKNQGKSKNRSNEGSEGGYNILFCLDLENFGQTRIDVRVGENSLWAAFYVDQNDSVSLLQQELPAFREILQALGYQDVLLAARLLGQLAPEKRLKFDALKVGIPSSMHLLDVKV